MTVQELIDLLRQQPPDHVVMVEGYETGWDTLVSVEASGMAPQRPCNAWDGEFERVSGSSLSSRFGEVVQTEREASALVKDVLFFLSQVLGDVAQRLRTADNDIDVRRLVVDVGNRSVVLGWLWQGDTSYFAEHWWWHRPAMPPTCRIRVTPDGRAQLTIHRHAPA